MLTVLSRLYMPHVDEVVLGVERGYILTEKNALHLVANQSFVDIFGKPRLAGDQWLVTRADSEVYIPDVHERVQSQVSLVSLTKRQYCIVRHPYDSARQVTAWEHSACSEEWARNSGTTSSCALVRSS